MERVVLVAGTRPEFIKLHPVAIALAAAKMDTVLVTTEQHRGGVMRDPFIEELVWPCPVEQLAVSARSPLDLLAEILSTLPKMLRSGDLVMAEGDTTSVLASALVANKLGYPLAHVEAGLRSYDLRMPEEHNRRLADHISDYLFAPTELDAGHLVDEHCPGKIYTVGNTVLDAVRQHIGRAPQRQFGRDFVLVTLHRQENVDDPVFLREMVAMLSSLDGESVFPIHPRTRDKMERFGLWAEINSIPKLRILEPLGYLEFLGALRDARVIVTDSGGIQEEATAPEIRRPVIVLRRSTERVSAVEAGFSILLPIEAGLIRQQVQDLSWFKPRLTSPFGDGRAAEAIITALRPIAHRIAC